MPVRDPKILPIPSAPEPGAADEPDAIPQENVTFALPAPGRERMYGRFDGIPPQVSTQRNIANRRRVIE